MDELDPAQRLQLDALGEEYYRRHGVAIEYLKAEVGAGDEYVNEAARAVLSPNGAWCECLDLPMEFTGMAGGPASHRFVTDETALALLERLHAMEPAVTAENTRQFGLFVLYTRAGIVDGRGVYVCQYERADGGMARRPRVIGAWQPGAMPLFFRCRLDTDLDAGDLPLRRGALFCLAHVGERNLLVAMPYESEDLRDLGDAPTYPAPQ